MSKIIERIWDGTLSCGEFFGTNNKLIHKEESLIAYYFEKLEEIVNQENSETLRECRNKVFQCMDDSAKQAFSDGFSLGMKMATESLANADELLENNH